MYLKKNYQQYWGYNQTVVLKSDFYLNWFTLIFAHKLLSKKFKLKYCGILKIMYF